MVEQVDSTNLLRALKDELDKGQPGMMFITPEQGHSFVLAFKDGMLASIYSGNAKGKEALELLAQVNSASYRFNATSAPVILPGTELTAADVAFLFDTPVAAPATEESAPATTETAVPSAVNFRTPVVELLREKLTDVMGPFAVVTLEDALASLPSTDFSSLDGVDGLVQKLALDIDDRRESAQFIEETRAALSKLYQNPPPA